MPGGQTTPCCPAGHKMSGKGLAQMEERVCCGAHRLVFGYVTNKCKVCKCSNMEHLCSRVIYALYSCACKLTKRTLGESITSAVKVLKLNYMSVCENSQLSGEKKIYLSIYFQPVYFSVITLNVAQMISWIIE